MWGLQDEGYELIRGEIEMLQQCNHPNVVRYMGSYKGEDYLWVPFSEHARLSRCRGAYWWRWHLVQIVMEYCGGGSVADLMNTTDAPLEEAMIAYICKEAAKVGGAEGGGQLDLKEKYICFFVFLGDASCLPFLPILFTSVGS